MFKKMLKMLNVEKQTNEEREKFHFMCAHVWNLNVCVCVILANLALAFDFGRARVQRM